MGAAWSLAGPRTSPGTAAWPHRLISAPAREYGMASRHALFEGQSDEETKAADGENRYHPGGERRLVEHQVLALPGCAGRQCDPRWRHRDRKSTRLNSSH